MAYGSHVNETFPFRLPAGPCNFDVLAFLLLSVVWYFWDHEKFDDAVSPGGCIFAYDEKITVSGWLEVSTGSLTTVDDARWTI